MKKILYSTIAGIIIIGIYIAYTNIPKIYPYYEQLTRNHIGVSADLQNDDQKQAHYVGSDKCKDCHKKKFNAWSHSRHPKMIQDINMDSSAVVADFSQLPEDADFKLRDAVYTIGGKFKQRFMIRKGRNGKEDYILGNYQWNVQTGKWQPFKPWKYWYKEAYPHNSQEFPTSTTCDGCHFTGYMSTQKRLETGIGCESCHGPASEHIENPSDSDVYLASSSDPVRQNEICLQCHMRNRDKRLETEDISAIYGNARDYPYGYEAGRPLISYKMPAPFTSGHETKEFYANGAARKNRTQGNEYVHSMMSKHGITCINCHNPHTLQPTAENNSGNALCMKCHEFGSVIGPHQESLEKHTHHKFDSKGSLCVECHMPKTGKHTGKSPLTVRSHQFGFVTPAQTIKYNMPPATNACYSCHQNDRDMQRLQNDLEKWGMIGWDKQ
jgi:hypothetical protein